MRSKQIATQSGCKADHVRLFTSTYAEYANKGSSFRPVATPGCAPAGVEEREEMSQIRAMQSSATVQMRLAETGDQATALTHLSERE